MRFDVIIPLYKPDQQVFRLLDLLKLQTFSPETILLLNTEKAYFDAFLEANSHMTEEAFFQEYPIVRVQHLKKAEFDHGRTRRQGVNDTRAPYFVMMTQDAIPVDDRLFEHLFSHLEGDVAVAYARQLAGEESGVLEQFSRKFNYPEEGRTKSAADLDRLGIKTFFCSDVCAAYRRDIYEKLGGFVERAIFNEDMIYAHTAIMAGYSVRYEALAQVVHAHNYTNMQQLHRNFDLGVSQAEHPEVFAKVSSESEGKKLVMEAISYLWRSHQAYRIPYFCMQTVSKYVGYLLGKRYQKLPRSWILKLTSNREYWK